MIPQSILSFFHAGKSLPFRSMTYFNFLLEATLAGSVLIVVVLVLRRVFRKQIGSRLVYLAWALVAIRLLLPVAIPNPLMDQFRPTLSTDAGARPVADQIRVRYLDALRDVSFWRLSSGTGGRVSPLERSLTNLTLELSTYTSYGWLGKGYLLCYGVGGLMVAAIFAGRHIRFRRRLKRNTVNTLEGEQLALYQDLCQRLGVRQLPVLYVDPLPSPCLVGVFKPVIALPLTLPPESLGEALMHELYHYKAKDPWWALVRCVCCAAHWFNPLVWIGQRFVKIDCELACDARVAARLDDAERLHYANTLILTVKQAYAPQAGVLATGMTMTGKRLKWRVNAILHMKAVQKVAAALVAVVLTVLTAAAFSTAESTQQTNSLAPGFSAFPFEENEPYPAPADVFGESIPLSPLRDTAEAEAQAKRYLLALYPQDREAIETLYRYRVEMTYDESGWEILVWPPEGGDTPRYDMVLGSGGGLVSVNRSDLFTRALYRGAPAALPANLPRVLMGYTGQLSAAVLQNAVFGQARIHTDVETDQGRYVTCTLPNADANAPSLSLTVQIAPDFYFVGLHSIVDNGVARPEADPPIERETQALAYSKDTSISFDAIFWGQTDSQHALSPEAALTVQQAFDIAVEAMLERSGLSREDFLQLPLQYGYYDKSNFEGDLSVWRFVWHVNPNDPMNRYWVDFPDMPAPPTVNISMPGEGLG